MLRPSKSSSQRPGDFGTFFDGRTPQDLLSAGIYSDLALALYSGPFWPVSVALVAHALGAHEREKGFSTAAAERKAEPLLHTSSAASGGSGVASGAVVAVAEEPSTSATTRPPPPPGKRLLRSASELSELTEGLAVAGPEDRQSTAKGGTAGQFNLAVSQSSLM